MQPVSVVIIAKNEAHVIAQTLQAVRKLTDDIIVCDTGSSDATIPIARKNGASIVEEEWKGYGVTKNLANEHAVYDWILQLDADEVIDEELQQAISKLDLTDEKQLYAVRRQYFFKEKPIRFGEWRNETSIRLFNRTEAAWNAEAIHEKLVYEKDCTVVKLKGAILHKTIQSVEQYRQKMKLYGTKVGEKYFRQKKGGAWFKQYLSPLLSFLKNYVFRLGFLDGRAGFLVAIMRAGYTGIKYKTVRKLRRDQRKP